MTPETSRTIGTLVKTNNDLRRAYSRLQADANVTLQDNAILTARCAALDAEVKALIKFIENKLSTK